MRIFRCLSSISILSLCTTTLIAQSSPTMEQIQVPHCLASHVPKTYSVLAENQLFKIIEVPSKELETITRLADKVGCGRFVNVSQRVTDGTLHQVNLERVNAQLNKPLLQARVLKNTYEIKHPVDVNAAIAKINTDQLWEYLTHLTNYTNRSATKDTGVQAAQWIKDTVDSMAVQANRTDVKTYFVATGRYKQPSLVTVIGKSIQAPAIVIGAHMDTLDGYMPGAGDDGSGSATLLEMTQVLMSSNYAYKRPIYIIWYAAEERGLVGSQYVVQDFLQKKTPVHAVMQFDMTGYRSVATDPSMWVFKDYTDSTLNTFTADLIKTYIKVPVKYSQCGYGCSDHASWMEEGFPASFPCESSFAEHNPYIHTSNDTLSLLNTDHLANFTKLALAFVIELGLS